MARQKTRRNARAMSLESAASALKRHFVRLPIADIVTSSREYPIAARVDLQRAIDELLPGFSHARQLGIHAEFVHETLTVGHLLGNHHSRVVIGPLQYEEIDIGDTLAARCVRRALWLAKDGELPFALILGPASRYGMPGGTSLEIAVPPGEKGAELA